MTTFPPYARIIDAGYSKKSDYGVLRTDMDGGIAKQRPRWTTPIVTRTVTILVHSVQDRDAFDAWMANEIRGGAGWFDWTDESGVLKQARIVGGDVSWTTPGSVWTGQARLETVG
ncbi:hypothetical protein I6I07_16050 [Achromobacter deleyi]|uniref:Phage tail protein n=1 Tax=Achromobacter deleyi TaxID=1353891 RepID=A0A7T4AYC4_9BURK|nr:hypothetical protein [Achromobacter deleyi]QQB32223.1 hypothetical protein I6I07_16050 [Achromobacter deleyi]